MSVKKHIEGSLPEGTIIKSPNHSYLIEEVLGAGGFGITYKVLRVSDRKTLALKEYFPSQLCTRGDDNTTMSFFKTNSESIKTGMADFITEANRLNRNKISHPNIVAVDEAFSANNTAYYTMEYVEGLNLRQYIKNENHNKPMTEEQAMSVMKLILQAVALLHANKLTHLDIKHENIILSREEDGSLRPVLIDFGQSKHYDRKGNATSQLTNAGCSDGFAPQEQYLGLTQFTPQADVYALCATLLYLVTAKVPAKSSEITGAAIVNMLGDKVSDKMRDAIVAGMKNSKADRTQSVAQLAANLGIDLEDQENQTSVTRILSINDKKEFGHKKIAILSGVAVIALILVAGIWWQMSKSGDTVDEQAQLVENVEDLTEPGAEDETPAAPVQAKENTPDKPSTVTDPKTDAIAQTVPATEAPARQETAATQQTPASTQPANQATQTPAPDPAPQPSSDSDDQLFAKANSTGDWDTMKKLADKGYKKAYLPLAKHYCSKAKTHNLADKYAKMAKAAGIAGADDVISILEGLGYYD